MKTEIYSGTRRSTSLQLFCVVALCATIGSFVAGCATVSRGNDPVVVNAERDTRLAADTFDLITHTEKDQRANLRAINPQVAAAVKTGVDKIRVNGKEWLKSARSMTQTYKYNRTPENKANLQTALAVVSRGVSEAQGYLNQINSTTNKANSP